MTLICTFTLAPSEKFHRLEDFCGAWYDLKPELGITIREVSLLLRESTTRRTPEVLMIQDPTAKNTQVWVYYAEPTVALAFKADQNDSYQMTDRARVPNDVLAHLANPHTLAHVSQAFQTARLPTKTYFPSEGVAILLYELHEQVQFRSIVFCLDTTGDGIINDVINSGPETLDLFGTSIDDAANYAEDQSWKAVALSSVPGCYQQTAQHYLRTSTANNPAIVTLIK